MDPAHRLGVQPRALVGEVVARDTGDRRVAQPHLLHALGDTARFVGVVVRGLAGVDLAEVAASGALRAADQEGRLAVLPALVDVGAAGLLAHGVQPLVLHEGVQRGVLGSHLRARLDPFRLALDRRLRVADLEAEELAAFGRRRCSRAAAPRLAAYSASKTETIESTMSAGATSLPTTSLTVVTPASVIPHGMMPRKPGERVVAVDREAVHRDPLLDAHSDRGDLVLGQRAAHPHPAAALDAVAVDAVLAERVDQQALEPTDVRHHVDRLGQPDDRDSRRAAPDRAR